MKLTIFAGVMTDAASRPTWGAWIETSLAYSLQKQGAVAPHVGRVD